MRLTEKQKQAAQAARPRAMLVRKDGAWVLVEKLSPERATEEGLRAGWWAAWRVDSVERVKGYNTEEGDTVVFLEPWLSGPVCCRTRHDAIAGVL